MRIQFLLLLFLVSGFPLLGQSYAWGIKGGPTIGIQRWGSFDRDALFRYHGILFIESVDEGSSVSLYAQAGYHVKGTSIRSIFSFSPGVQGAVYRPRTNNFEFNTISVTAGGKKRVRVGSAFDPYYLLGVRGDYTLSTNLNEYNDFNNNVSLFYPVEGFVNRWGYGVQLGAGVEFPFSELVGGLLELTVNPNFSKQYFQPPIPNVVNPYRPGGNSITLPERNIYNLTFELTLGFRFLHKIIYLE